MEAVRWKGRIGVSHVSICEGRLCEHSRNALAMGAEVELNPTYYSICLLKELVNVLE